jgi:hypothetical protein
MAGYLAKAAERVESNLAFDLVLSSKVDSQLESEPSSDDISVGDAGSD